MRERADKLLADRGLAPDRERSQALIMAGRVTSAGRPVRKPGDLLDADAALEVAAVPPFVSRGGLKLAEALDRFGLDVRGLVGLDIGALVAGAQGSEADPSPAAAPRDGSAAAVAYAFVVTLRSGLKEVRQYAAKRGVETRRAFGDAVLTLRDGESAEADPLEAAGAEPGVVPGEFPRAYELLLRSLQFPLYPALAKKDVQLITKILASLP